MDFSNYWLPENISTHGAAIDHLITVLHWFMAVLFIGWGIYFVFCLIKFRARPGHDADPTEKHFKIPTYLEVGVMLFEVFLLVFLSSPIWFSYKNELPNEADAVVLRIVAEQFAWHIHYPGKDGKFGKTKIEAMDGVNPLGIDREDPDAKDDIYSANILNVPINKPVIIELSSKDVIHSINIPVMRIKQDAVPGMVNKIWFQATKTGQYDIACAQLCGNGHYNMKGQLVVQTPEEYQKFIDEQTQALVADASGGTN